MDALATRQHTGHSRERSIIVDKANAIAYGLNNNQIVMAFPVLLGSSRQDDFQRNINVFAQKTTAAGAFYDAHAYIDPSLDPQKYQGQVLLGFSPIHITPSGRAQTLAFHSVLGAQDRLNIKDKDKKNNYISNGCIRVGQIEYMRLLNFTLGPNVGWLNQEHPEGSLSFMKLDVDIYILPEVYKQKGPTLRMLCLDDYPCPTRPRFLDALAAR